MPNRDREMDSESGRSKDASSARDLLEPSWGEISILSRTGGVDVRELIATWKVLFNRQDADKLAELYRSDALLEVSDLSVQVYGKASIRELFRRVLEPEGGDAALLKKWEPVAADDRLAAVQYRIDGGPLNGEGLAMFGVAPGGIAFDKRFLTKRHQRP